MEPIKQLPACPVETTLMLIGDKWKVLILRDLLPGTKRFGELKKIHWLRVTKSLDSSAPRHGSKRSGQPKSICRGTASRRIQPDRFRSKPEPYFKSDG